MKLCREPLSQAAPLPQPASLGKKLSIFPKAISQGATLILMLFLVGFGCIDMEERVCKDNKNCQKTEEPTVCYQRRCLPKVCELYETKPCYTGPPKTMGVGACRSGAKLCDKAGSAWSTCLGQILPVNEFCDGIDNDCDGEVDEGLQCKCEKGKWRSCYTAASSLSKVQHISCRKGIQYCLDSKTWGPCLGQLGPLHRFRRLYNKTSFQGVATALLRSCQNQDKNCDGVLDRDWICSCKPNETRPCYDGPPATLSYGVGCKQGTQRCILHSRNEWHWGFCEGQQLPLTEELLGCNGVDDDCDGIIDNQTGTTAPLWKPCPPSQGSCLIRTCEKGTWSKCQNIELCKNNLDDDCDGSIDEGC